MKNVKTARGLISLSFRCGVKIIKTVEVSQYVKFTYKISHNKGILEKIGREYYLQPELLDGEIEQSVIIESNFADLKHIWEALLKSDVLFLAYLYGRHSMEMHKKSVFGIKDRLTEASLG